MSRPGRIPARVRIMGWLLGLMVLVLAAVVLMVWRLSLTDVDNRVNRGLEQEVREFADFVSAGRDPRTGEPITDPTRLLAAHLSTQYPENNEVHAGVVVQPDRMTIRVEGNPAYDMRSDEALFRRIIDAPAGYGDIDTAGGTIRWAKSRLTGEGIAPSYFVTAYFVGGMRAAALSTVRILLLVSGFGLVLAAGVAWVVAGRVLAPVRTVRQAAAEITEHDLSRRIPVHGKDDIAALAEQFNAMLDRLDQAFATQRSFLDDAGHELRTPITIVQGHLELMGDDPAERAEVVRLCTDELDRMNRIVGDLLLLAKAERPDFVNRHEVSLHELTSDIDAKVRALGDRRWVLEAMGEGTVRLDEQRVTQAVVQLAQNAVQHTEPGSEIRIGSALIDGRVSFWVADSGPGVRPEEHEKIFQRFGRADTGRRDRTGAGLGLAIVLAIAEAHHGVAKVVSEPGRGATFGIDLPATEEEQ
ncbi:ATP-binding protein [Allokutzneria sp. A3M-2-11 16]|uniref:sensor histidine kinase n=1 Tax=Allokutzneria sp. A3M-2-11 16 TaxID=2962043 RepID=UPI0020B7ED70|nr:ATP-binding protein [Allokutzneria sp. A3M-2-11 16]MCP3799566.1 ATP-binding protein [Allokutzneria sp. A3M-2-11 16]